MWFIGVEVEQETSAPPPKKNPGSAPAYHPGYCSSRNIDMLSTEGFYFLKKKGLLQRTVDNEVPASATLPFYESLLIGQETSVLFYYYSVSVSSGLNLEKK